MYAHVLRFQELTEGKDAGEQGRLKRTTKTLAGWYSGRQQQ